MTNSGRNYRTLQQARYRLRNYLPGVGFFEFLSFAAWALVLLTTAGIIIILFLGSTQ